MIVTIKRMGLDPENEISFMNILETLKSNRMERGEKIIALNKKGAYKSRLSLSGKSHDIIKIRINNLIRDRVILDGDIIITNNNNYISCFSVIRGQLINTI